MKAPFTVYIVSTGTTDKAVWRNGSASDYESGGCSFEYYLGHLFYFCFSPDRFLITIHDFTLYTTFMITVSPRP